MGRIFNLFVSRRILHSYGNPVNSLFAKCVSKVKMSPITAELKCPHGRGKDTIGSEAVTGVASHEDGGGRADHLINRGQAIVITY